MAKGNGSAVQSRYTACSSDDTYSTFSESASEDGDIKKDSLILNPPPVTFHTYLYAFCSALNSVNLGYDIGVSTNAGPRIQDYFQLTNFQLEIFLGSINFWSIFGVMISPILTDRFGRRTTFVTAAIGFIVGITIMSTANSYEVLLVGRLVVGIGCGVGEAVDPMYIAEIAPTHVRGQLVSWAEAGVSFGVVLGFASSLLPVGWRGMLGLGGILPFVMILVAKYIMPESPRWLVQKKQVPAARVVLQRIYPECMVDQVVNEIEDSLALEEAAATAVGWSAILKPSPSVRRMLIVGVGIAIIQQAIGIDAIMYYLMFVLEQSGITDERKQALALIALGTVKLVFVFVGARLFDTLGRRPLLFTSLIGCAFSLVLVSFTFTSESETSKVLTVVGLAFYLAFFSIGIGPGNWVVVSEVFATSIRAKAMSVAVFPNRVTATIMASTFLSIAHAVTWPVFFLALAGICLGSALFLFIYLPETKGKSLEEMAHYFAEVTGDRTILDVEERLRNERKLERQLESKNMIELSLT
jgi:sugar porter (SP) family MFS transporter